MADVHCCNHYDCFFWTGSDSHGNSGLCFLLQNLHLHSTLHCDVLWLLPKQLKHNWFCFIKFNLCCEVAFLNCFYTKHELCVATYACLVGLLTPLLLLFLRCWLVWISSRAWHLPSRHLMIASSSAIPWETAFISHCFLVTSSTCSINIWDNTLCKGMLKANALTAFKLLWNWLIKLLNQSLIPCWSLAVTIMTSHELQLLDAHCYTYHIPNSRLHERSTV